MITATKKNVTVDTTPTVNSTNPVQSGGVKAALDGKQDALTFPLSVSNGGTATDSYKKIQAKIFRQTTDDGSVAFNTLATLPTLPGVYRIGQPLSDLGLPSNHNGYGALVGFLGGDYWLKFTSANNGGLWYSINPINSKNGKWYLLAKRAITANMGTVTGTGSTVTVTKTVTGVTGGMTVDRIEFGTPSAVQSGWTVITATDSVTFSATISGSTTVKIKLSDNMDVTGT